MKTQAVNHVIKTLRIEKCADTQILLVSGGERKRCNIGTELLTNPSILLLDEPFNGIAPIQRENIQEIIQEQSQFKGFIITDHDYRSILKIATKTILLHDGGTKIIHSNEELVEWGYLNEL